MCRPRRRRTGCAGCRDQAAADGRDNGRLRRPTACGSGRHRRALLPFSNLLTSNQATAALQHNCGCAPKVSFCMAVMCALESSRRRHACLPNFRAGSIAAETRFEQQMSVRELYEALTVSKKIERDPAQERLLVRLEALEQRVAAHRSARRSHPIGWLFGQSTDQETAKGLYVFGDVGRGKTMLMDLCFE